LQTSKRLPAEGGWHNGCFATSDENRRDLFLIFLENSAKISLHFIPENDKNKEGQNYAR
jgi:hypothetical protein